MQPAVRAAGEGRNPRGGVTYMLLAHSLQGVGNRQHTLCPFLIWCLDICFRVFDTKHHMSFEEPALRQEYILRLPRCESLRSPKNGIPSYTPSLVSFLATWYLQLLAWTRISTTGKHLDRYRKTQSVD